MALGGAYDPLCLFPGEVWNLIVQKMKPSTFDVFRHAFPELQDVITPSNFAQKLFSSVFTVLYEEALLRPDDVRACRLVCSDWKERVDDYFQTTNFNCLEKKHGPKNCSGYVLRMPMELVDIDKIHKMELHPGCVSFGKKLTLMMRHDQQNIGVFPSHLHEIANLLRTVTRFWQRFEHLEVRQAEATTDVDYAGIWLLRHENPDYIVVPFGDVGTHEKFQDLRSLLTTLQIPDDFEMYIPFLHLVTNLKKVSLLIRDNRINARILHRIPKTANLEEISMNSHEEWSRGFWSMSCAVMYQQCAKSVNFLACVTPVSIRTMADWINAYDGTGPVFEKLKEVHILVDPGWTHNLVDNMCAFTIASMFPMVTTLVLSVDIRYVQTDLWKHLGTFVDKFPCLTHFSLSGDCVPQWCVDKTVAEAKLYAMAILSNIHSVLTTFQFWCPIHVPVGLMQMFPSLTHVIIEERPGRCQLYDSKANDWKYVNGFFNTFPNVTSLSFVPVTTGEQTHDDLTSSRKVTRLRCTYKGGNDLSGQT